MSFLKSWMKMVGIWRVVTPAHITYTYGLFHGSPNSFNTIMFKLSKARLRMSGCLHMNPFDRKMK